MLISPSMVDVAEPNAAAQTRLPAPAGNVVPSRSAHPGPIAKPIRCASFWPVQAARWAMQVVLATSTVAERKRLQYWRDAVRDTFGELECPALSETPFFGEIAP